MRDGRYIKLRSDKHSFNLDKNEWKRNKYTKWKTITLHADNFLPILGNE